MAWEIEARWLLRFAKWNDDAFWVDDDVWIDGEIWTVQQEGDG